MLNALKRRLAQAVGRENLEFLGHTRNYFSASLLQGLLVAATVPLLTQLLSPGEYGVLGVFTSLVSLLTIVFGLNLRSGIVRYYLEKNPDFDRALGTNLVFLLAFNGVMLVAILALSAPLARTFAIDEVVFRYAALASVLSIGIEVYMTHLQGAARSARHALLTVLRTGLTLALAVGLMLLLREKRYLGRIYAELVLTGLFSLYAYVALGRIASFTLDGKYLRYTLAFSLPLIPHSASRLILGYFDRIIINQFSTRTELGLYSFAYDVGMAMEVLVLATMKAWQPVFYEAYRTRDLTKINRMVGSYTGYICFAALSLILFAADLVRLLVPEAYFGAVDLIPIVVLGYLFVFLYTVYFQYAAFRRKTGLISLATMTAGAANIWLNYSLIPVYGYRAAAYTSLASFALLFLLHFLNARVVLREATVPLRTTLPGLLIVGAVTAGYLLVDDRLPALPLFVLKAAALALAFAHLVLRPGEKRAGA